MIVKDKVALVTASSRGIGLSCVQTLAKNGSKVYLAGFEMDKGQEEVDKLKKDGYNAEAIYFDATDIAGYATMIETVIQKEGKLDILVNNFGTTNVKYDKDLLEGDSEQFFQILNKNIASVYYACKHTIPYMKEQKSGSIINISSIGGAVPDTSRLAYGAAKAAINHLTQSIAIQYADHNVRCNAVLPGFIATDAAMNNMSPEFLEMFLANVPLNRVGTPEDISNAVLFLASDLSSYMTGELLEVAGGFGKPTPIYSFIKNKG